jgi:hypothetical protein
MKRRETRGRKTTLSAPLQCKICALLAQGSAIKSACLIVRISERVFYDWRIRGKAGEEPFARFFFFCSDARARSTQGAAD